MTSPKPPCPAAACGAGRHYGSVLLSLCPASCSSGRALVWATIRGICLTGHAAVCFLCGVWCECGLVCCVTIINVCLFSCFKKFQRRAAGEASDQVSHDRMNLKWRLQGVALELMPRKRSAAQRATAPGETRRSADSHETGWAPPLPLNLNQWCDDDKNLSFCGRCHTLLPSSSSTWNCSCSDFYSVVAATSHSQPQLLQADGKWKLFKSNTC